MNEKRRNNRAPDKGSNLDDRRTFERHQFGQMVQVVWMDGHQVSRQIHQYRAVDLSRGGLRLLGKQMQYENTVGVVMLRRGDGQCVLRGIRVRSSVYSGGLLYASGCEFVATHERLVRAVRLVNDRLQFSERVEDFV